MKLSEILRAGKQRIETLGWCQGDHKAIDQQNRFGCCTATALLSRDAVIDLDVMAATYALKIAIGLDVLTSISSWNDAPERTVADVLAAYDKAIAAAEAQEQAQ